MTSASLNIAVVGATGNIGRHIQDEALGRGHRVTAVVRDSAKVAPAPGLVAREADTGAPAAFADILRGHDLAVFSLRWTDHDVASIIAACKLADLPRAIFVIGSSSLIMPDGRRWFDHIADRKVPGPTGTAGVAAFAVIAAETALNWTAISTPGTIGPGERTGRYRVGDNHFLTDAAGESRISREDFAVAVVDEAERPGRIREHITAAY